MASKSKRDIVEVIDENRSIFLKRTSAVMYDLEQVGDILVNFGLVKNRRIAQRWVREGKIEAEWLNGEDDRRAGKIVTERELYKTVTTQIPALGVIYKALDDLKKQNEQLRKELEASKKQTVKENEQTIDDKKEQK
ncbi:hypothetical protein PDK93_27805 [Bacillus cereus]|nr:hypothetical protein [Bacillus cereus]